MRNIKKEMPYWYAKTIFLEKRCHAIRRSCYNNEYWVVEDYWMGKGKGEHKIIIVIQ